MRPTITALLRAHVFLAAYLFSYALVGSDPAPHRAGLPTRTAVLVLTISAHNVLAKTIYATPPEGVAADQAAVGAQLMYDGGAPIEIALIVLLGNGSSRSALRPGLEPGVSVRDLEGRVGDPSEPWRRASSA